MTRTDEHIKLVTDSIRFIEVLLERPLRFNPEEGRSARVFDEHYGHMLIDSAEMSISLAESSNEASREDLQLKLAENQIQKEEIATLRTRISLAREKLREAHSEMSPVTRG